jgi:pSer/pThr/pTyr-binding forkhead associated (FHA) protein
MTVDTAPPSLAIPPSLAVQPTERFAWRRPAAPVLVIRAGGCDIRLGAGQSYTVGRDPECDIVVADSRVSRRHAVVRFAPSGWTFEDVGSANGTFLGTSRVDSFRVSSDCLIRLGDPQDGAEVHCRVIHPEPGGTDVPAPRAAGRGPDSHTVTVQRAAVRVLRIGRAPDNDLVLADLGVSRYHAELRNPGSGPYEITDLQSHNGIFVNGQRVSSATVTERDIIGIGRAKFRVVADELRELADGERVSSATGANRDIIGVGRAAFRTAGDRAGAWLRTKAPARPPLLPLGLATATTVTALLALAAIGLWLGQPLLIPPLAASMALIASASALPLAQPRNVIAGQLLSALVGFAALAVGGPGIWTAATAGGLALGAMLLLRVAHSPAAATAVIVGATAPPAARFLELLAAATVILVAFGVLGARIEGKKYPVYWW